eukprot:UN03078
MNNPRNENNFMSGSRQYGNNNNDSSTNINTEQNDITNAFNTDNVDSFNANNNVNVYGDINLVINDPQTAASVINSILSMAGVCPPNHP